MDFSRKEKILIGIIATTMAAAIGGSAWALLVPKHTAQHAPQHEVRSNIKPHKTGKSRNQDTAVDETSTANSDTQPNPLAQSSASTTLPSTSSTQVEQASIQPPTQASILPRTTSQAQPNSCNETMKSVYTATYESRLNAETASWANQVNAWNNQASSSGISFSGYTQALLEQYRPAHLARLSQIQSEYQQNLANINC